MGNKSLYLPVRLDMGMGDAPDIEKINRHTLEQLSEDDVFTFSGIASNDRMDAFFTRMDPETTLQNYARDLKNGVSLQSGHDITQNPFGRSYNGVIVSDDDGSSAVRGSWYLLRGTTINGENSDDTIRALKAGIIRDLSVGFGGDLWYRCGTCGHDVFDFEHCNHIPGLEDENGQRAFAWVKDATLREVSCVYKGATPNAYIDKAREYVGQGELARNQIQQLEKRFQTRLDDNSSRFYINKGGNTNMNLLEQLRSDLKENKIEKSRVYEILSQEGETFRQPDDIALRNQLGESASVEAVKRMQAEAEQGRAYVTDMIDNAVKARVRAQGDAFNQENYRNMLTRSADLAYIKEEIETYDQLAGNTFTPGRQTNPDDPGGRGQGGGSDDDVVTSENFKGDEA